MNAELEIQTKIRRQDNRKQKKEKLGVNRHRQRCKAHYMGSMCVKSMMEDRPTFKHIHHVEKGQGQRRLPTACATADAHLIKRGRGGGRKTQRLTMGQ